MSIKVTITEKAETAEWDYPLVVQSIHYPELIILACQDDREEPASYFEGIVLRCKDGSAACGRFDSWIKAGSRPFPGTITLKNDGGAE